ncbi:LOW QUALITY PROTEIN: 2-acylglycerol O-acyltransferase 3-like, partial [Phaenicophaeus curvirostris]|uniref:LOW QUALITY PROTEIN: 2-acylglycerol O-acyltransferase 3-like n=1 Tax=Phaenicophaeus curvirostris TaxID=33595 RepID=UPI0037F0B166
VIRSAPLSPGRTYLLAAHPHGVACIGVFGAFVTGGRGAAGTRNGGSGRGGPCPGLRPTSPPSTGSSTSPLQGIRLAAGLCPVSRRCLDRVLEQRDQALVIMVGGAAEALEGTPGSHRVVLRRRKGFVRLALRHGTPLVPVYVFGEQETFRQPALSKASRLRRLQRRLKDLLGFAPCFFWGRGGLPFLPFAVPLTVVVGAPLFVPRIPRPSEREVDRFHQLYLQRLQSLFEEHKVACGLHPETRLHIL